MDDNTNKILTILIDSLKLQNDAMKSMAKQIDALQEAVKELESREVTEVHNHYHNTYSYPRYPYYPYYTPTYSSSGSWTINSGTSISGGYSTTTNSTNLPNSIKE